MIDPGTTAPEVTLFDSSGFQHPLRSLADQPTLLVFFKTDCPVSHEVLPVYAALRRYEPAVQVLGISQDDPEATDDFLQAIAGDLPTFFDQEPFPTSRAFDLQAVPAAALVVEGRVIWAGEGWRRDAAERLAERLSSLAGSEPILENADDLPPFKPG